MPIKHSLNKAEEMHISNYPILDFGFAKGQEAPHKGSLTIAEELHIPDYVMLDFGFLKATRTSGKLPA